MEKGNILVIGNSGVGKSTLINAVLGEEKAETGFGTSGTTKKLKIYENDSINFRIVDTMGFEQSFIRQAMVIHSVKKWSKTGIEKGKSKRHINVIWFCIDGCTSKLFDATVRNMLASTSVWKSVPIIIVVTKSYSAPDRDKNIEMIEKALSKYENSRILKDIIPVVAQTYEINKDMLVPPEGITELIDATVKAMPEGIKASDKDIKAYKLNRKRALAQTFVGGFAVSGAVVGAIPIPFSDAILLTPLEIAEINAIATIYGINKNEETKRFINSIVEVGTVSVGAKALISGLKAIPVINIGAEVLNAIVASTIITAIGEGAIIAFDEIYLGKKSTADIDWVKKIIESSLSNGLIEKIESVSDKFSDKMSPKDIGKIIASLLQ